MSDREIHAGYEFEAGMFARVRSWVDLAPWIRLIRVLRLLASPLYVGLVFLTLVITVNLFTWLVDENIQLLSMLHWDTNLARLAQSLYSSGFLVGIASLLMAVIVWVPVTQIVARGGAELVVGRPLPGIGKPSSISRSRIWLSYLVPIVPWACVLVFGLLIFAVRVPSMMIGNQAFSILTGWIIGLLSIPVGVLAFGALIAIPLGTVAMVCEPDPDPIDSLSRGYEYLARRPLSLVWYLVVSAAMLVIAGTLLGGVCWASSTTALSVGSLLSRDFNLILAAMEVIGLIAVAWQVTLALGLLGGIYLLLRHDAGGQEVEDLWGPEPPKSTQLPELPEGAFRS